MCMQCISVQDDQPTQRLLLKADSCNVHCATYCSKISRRLRNYTSTSVLKKNNKNYSLHHRVTTMIEYRSHAYQSFVQKKRHITQQVTVPKFPPEYVPTSPSRLVPTIVEICCRRVERSLMLRITILGRLYQIPDNFKSDVSIALSIR